MTEDKRFHWLKEHYEDIESFAYVGMVFWFVPFVFAFSMFRNNIIDYICIFMFFLHLIGVMVFFEDDRLWRWIQ